MYVLVHVGPGCAANALGTIRESSSSWGSTTNLQSAFSGADTEADTQQMTKAGSHVTAPDKGLQPADTVAVQRLTLLPAPDVQSQSPSRSDSGLRPQASEFASSVQLELNLEAPDSSPASSVRSEAVSEAGIVAEPRLMTHVTGTKCMQAPKLQSMLG